jgi:hypothetical protein
MGALCYRLDSGILATNSADTVDRRVMRLYIRITGDISSRAGAAMEGPLQSRGTTAGTDIGTRLESRL